MRTLAKAALALVLVSGPAARADVDTEPYAGVSVEQLYDSNVENSHGADGVTRVTPRLGFLFEGPRLKLDLDYRVGFHEYDTGTIDNSINQRAAVMGRALLSPRLTADTRIVLISGEDPILLDRPGVFIPDGGFTDLEAHIGAAYAVTRRVSFEAAYLFRLSRFDLADIPNGVAFNGDEHRADLSLGYQWDRRLTLRALARGQHFITYGAPEETTEAVGGGLGFDYAFTSILGLRVEAGPLYFSGSGGTVTWFANASLAHRGEDMRWSISAFRDLYGGTSTADAIWAEAAGVTGVFRLTRDIDLRLRAAVYRDGFAPSESAVVNGIVGRADIGTYIFRNNARFELYGEHRGQDTSGGLAFGDLQRTVVGVRLVAFAGVDLLSLGDMQ
jgi:hypothetical protein